MHRALLVMIILLLALLTFGAPQAAEIEFATYEEMRAHIGKLYQEHKYAEAARVLEKALARFPDRYRANAYNLALMYVHLKEFEKASAALESALGKGIFFSKYDFLAEAWAPLKDLPSFKTLLERNAALVAEARKTAKPTLEVVTPEGLVQGQKYPLFLGLHGGGENIRIFRQAWTSERLRKEFIVGYLQSSQLIGQDAYNWTEDIELTKKEVVEAYAKIAAQYPVDEGRVVIGGFSSGGVAALEVSLAGLVPVRGFIVLCPGKPDGFTAESVLGAKERGLRGVLMTTELDNRLDQQKGMDTTMTAQGFPHQFFVAPNTGHWYPEDIGRRIDEGLEFILQDQKK